MLRLEDSLLKCVLLKILEACSDGKEEFPIGYVKLEIIEGADMKPSDLNSMLLLFFVL